MESARSPASRCQRPLAHFVINSVRDHCHSILRIRLKLIERLILIEIAALAASLVYLNPTWPNVDGSLAQEQPRLLAPCLDCGTEHREVFELQRWGEGDRFGREWSLLIVPVIKRWGEYIEWYAHTPE